MSQTPFERAKEALEITNDLLRTCRNYYVLDTAERSLLNNVIGRTVDAEQELQTLMLRVDQ